MPTDRANLPIVAILVFDGVKLLDATGPFQVFADARRDDGSAYRCALVSLDGGPVSTDAGIALGTEPVSDVLSGTLDTFLVAGGDGAVGAAACDRHGHAVARAARHARRLGSICTGAFVLAAGGHLDGRAATTHWASCAELAARHPSVEVRADAIFVEDGPVWTSAGVSAGIDMALAMVEADLGRDEALRLARELVLYLKRPGGQEQFSAPLRAQVAATGPLSPLLAYIRAHPTDDLGLACLAARAGMSVRTLARRFEREVGATPAAHVERVRVDAACEAFCLGERSVKRVASRAGFGSEERMRRAFQRVKGIAPSEYRDRFSR